MAGINPISGVGGGIPPLGGAGTAGGAKRAGNKTAFGNLFRQYVNNVDQDQQEAGVAIRDLVTGKTQDILPVVQAVAKADLSFKLLVGVRNKVIEAYRQTMNMQI